jgi:maleylacetate reductase
MGLTFAHDTLAQRVVFGTGRAEQNLAAETDRLGARSVMLIVSETEQSRIGRLVASMQPAHVHRDVAPHVPVAIVEQARAEARAHRADLLVSIGGGSTTGLAKAVALDTGLPIVAVPTTYAGSEATNVWGITEASRKTTGVDDRVLPAVVVYDAMLSRSLPLELTVGSGLNAVAHCVDTMWAPAADPINQATATDALQSLAEGLRRIHADADDIDAREQLLYGAYLAAVAFASAGPGLHHKICHVLGGAFDLPHAATHAVVLPYVLAFNAPFAPLAARRIASALGADDATSGLDRLRSDLGAPRALRDLGMREGDLDEAVDLVARAVPPSNPRPASRAELDGLLRAAWAGADPASMIAR